MNDINPLTNGFFFVFIIIFAMISLTSIVIIIISIVRNFRSNMNIVSKHMSDNKFSQSNKNFGTETSGDRKKCHKIKCDYCGTKYDADEEKCPNCGASNDE